MRRVFVRFWMNSWPEKNVSRLSDLYIADNFFAYKESIVNFDCVLSKDSEQSIRLFWENYREHFIRYLESIVFFHSFLSHHQKIIDSDEK